MSDFEAKVASALSAGDAHALMAFEAAASSKAERKAVKRALHLLSERGVVVDRRPFQPAAPVEPIPLALMGPPDDTAGRLFTLAFPEGAHVLLFEAYFRMPQGLQRLGCARSLRSDYAPWARAMCASRGALAPARTALDDGLAARKLWEIREHVRMNRFGSDVDAAALRQLPFLGVQPPHPAEAPLPEGGAMLSPEVLAEESWRLAPFLHAQPLAVIRQQLAERGSALFEVTSPLEVVVGEWAAEWGHDRLRETLLDLTSYASSLGDHDAAFTFQHAALGNPVGFLESIVPLLLEATGGEP